MEEARKNPETYHGVQPFNPETGKFLSSSSSTTTFPKIFGKHILSMAEKDPDLITITPAMSAGSKLDAFIKKFPDRCFDVGIAESHSVTFAGGIAHGRKKKVVAVVYASFIQRALDNIFHDVCLQEIPVVFCLDRGGLSGPDGATHHGIYDISFLNAMPNMIITQPRDGKVLKELLESAFSWERPVAIRYPNMKTQDSNDPLSYRPLGKGEILAEGNDILLIGLGHMNQTALEVRKLLEDSGVTATVFDPVFVKPLDSELLDTLLSSHKRIVTIEEHSAISGLGAILNNFIITNDFSNIQVLNLGIPEAFLDQGSYKDVINEIGLTPQKITKRILSHFSLKEITNSKSYAT